MQLIFIHELILECIKLLYRGGRTRAGAKIKRQTIESASGDIVAQIIFILVQKAEVKLLSTTKDEKDLINNYGFPFNNKLLFL